LTTARLYLDLLKPGTKKEGAIIEKTRGFLLDAINEIRNISKEMVLPNLKGKHLRKVSGCAGGYKRHRDA